MAKSRIEKRILMAIQRATCAGLESDQTAYEHRLKREELAGFRRLELLHGLTRRQRTFVIEKLLGHTDKDAALLAGYSLSVAENTKQRIWKAAVRNEFERLRPELAKSLSANVVPPQ